MQNPTRFILCLMSALCMTISAAAVERTLYAFSGGRDGKYPTGGLTRDSSGNLYGTTLLGGKGYGVVFELTRVENLWSEKVLHTFSGSDGAYPTARMIFDKAGNLYGTTESGGTHGAGTIFELSPLRNSWKQTVLWDFNQKDGNAPDADLVFDAAGNLYGTASEGGEAGDQNCNGGCGTVFELSPGAKHWSLTVLHYFQGTDGSTPQAALVFDKARNLYGTTLQGGPNYTGVVFEMSPSASGWTEQVLHAFAHDGHDGAYPDGPLLFDKSGFLYGSANVGGEFLDGVVFRIDPQSGSESTIYSFHGTGDEGVPIGNLAFDKAGNLCGATAGANLGPGTAFELTPENGTWRETTLYDFSGGTDGDTPESGLIVIGERGYGTASGVQGQYSGVVYAVSAAPASASPAK